MTYTNWQEELNVPKELEVGLLIDDLNYSEGDTVKYGVITQIDASRSHHKIWAYWASTEEEAIEQYQRRIGMRYTGGEYINGWPEDIEERFRIIKKVSRGK